MTTDVAAARSFYGALFGWETEDYPGEGMNYVMVKVGGEAVGGMMTLPPECAGMPPAWGVYVTVDDVDATARQVETLGGKVLRPPEDIPDIGRFCVLQDPQGDAVHDHLSTTVNAGRGGFRPLAAPVAHCAAMTCWAVPRGR